MNAGALGYNERLFSGRGLRSFFHTARFRWVHETAQKLGVTPRRVIELGCFDGRLLDFLPVRPERYVGLDAGWEGGLESAQRKYAAEPAYSFIQSTSPITIAELGETFDVGASLETLEHVPPELVDGYIDELARAVTGYLLVTVPNEKGVVFAGKWTAKKLIFGRAEPYTPGEFIAAVTGRMDRVARREHKGFDYAALIKQLERRFDIVRVEGIPFGLPPALSFGVGIVARARG